MDINIEKQKNSFKQKLKIFSISKISIFCGNIFEKHKNEV